VADIRSADTARLFSSAARQDVDLTGASQHIAADLIQIREARPALSALSRLRLAGRVRIFVSGMYLTSATQRIENIYSDQFGNAHSVMLSCRDGRDTAFVGCARRGSVGAQSRGECLPG